MNPLMHQAIHSFYYPIVQNEAGVDLPLEWPSVASGLVPNYAMMNIAPNTSASVIVYIRRGMDFLMRTIRLQVFGGRDLTDLHTDASALLSYSDLLLVSVVSEGFEAPLNLSRPQSCAMVSPIQAGGGAELVFKCMMPQRSTITLTFTNPTANIMAVGGHLAGSVFRRYP